MLRNYIGKEKAWQKIKHYCAYQERSHAEAREKQPRRGKGKTVQFWFIQTGG